MSERLSEADADLKDKELEREELEKLKSEIFSGKYDNPTQEFERQKQQMEQRYKPKILIDLNLEENQQREQEFQREKAREMDRAKARERRMAQKERYIKEKSARELSTIDVEPIDSDSVEVISRHRQLTIGAQSPTMEWKSMRFHETRCYRTLTHLQRPTVQALIRTRQHRA